MSEIKDTKIKTKVKITVDGKEIIANQGENLLKVALANDIDIPNLCYHEKITPTGSCRLCIVKIEGQKGCVPSCTVEVKEGMKIVAFDDQLENMRKMILDMILATHNDDCITCSRDGDCVLQDLAFRYNLGRGERKLPPIWNMLNNVSDESSQVLSYDATKCISCERCIKVCYEVQGKGVLSYANRGIDTYTVAGFNAWRKSECDGCGECLQICPVGAITMKPIYSERKRIRKKDADQVKQTTCPYCGVGCQLKISIRKNKIIKVMGAEDLPNNGKTCVKGRFGLDFVNRPERLTRPLIKKQDKFVEVSWEEATGYIAKRFKEIKDKYGVQAIAGLSSARCTNEENFVFQKFIRSVIGTNNVDHCARLCHASTVAGLAASFGSGAMTNSIEEIEHSDVILVTGSNTTETHPVIATHIKRAVLFNGAKLIVVDPRKIDLVEHATVWLQQKNGTDVAWINAMSNVIVNENLHNQNFIKERTEDFDKFLEVIKNYSPEKAEEITSIPQDKLKQAAQIYGQAKKATIIYSMGITQHTTGTDNVKSLANLAMLTGNIGRESTGVNPLRGQNNVQGACDLGALPNVYPGYQSVTNPQAQEKFEKAWGAKLSDKVGLTIIEMLNAACAGEVKACYFMGENPMLSDPNINHVREALEKLDFLVCQDIFPTETTEFADVILPAASFAEKDGTFTNTERRVLPIYSLCPPVGEAKPDWEIVQLIAKKMGVDFGYNNVKNIREEINLLTPQYGGITHERIESGEKLQWPCPTKEHLGTKYLHKDKFVKGKGTFFPVEYIAPKENVDSQYPFVLSTGRMLYHYHTGTMTRKTKALPQYQEGPYVEMNPEDLKKLGVKDGDKVKVSSRRGEIEIPVLETKKVVCGSVFIPFHFAEAAANILTIDAIDPIAKIPEYKVCAVAINKI